MNGGDDSKKFRNQKAIELINKCISLKDKDMTRNNEILKNVLNDVLQAMKDHDDLFRDLFQKLEFIGSFYKGTKVGKPEEFDVDLIIKLPVQYESIVFVKALPGYTKLKLSKDCYTPKWDEHSKILSKWVDLDGYLNQNEFRQWMESMFTRALPKLPVNPNYKVQVRKSGPAFTLYVTQADTLEMCVDLVPALEFNKKPPLRGDFRAFSWYAVPKPFKSGENTHLLWRMSFYNHEKYMLTKHGDLKPLIRQVKKLRDKENWKLLPSYHIETLFMHYIREMEKTPDSQKVSGTMRFLHCLKRLKEACEAQKLTNFWDDSHNLIEADRNQLASIIGRLGKVIKQINDDPVTIAECVLTKEELADIKEKLNAIRNPRDSVKSEDHQVAEASETSFLYSLGSFANNIAKIVMEATGPIPGTTTNVTTSSVSGNGNSESAEIMTMLRLIHRDLIDVKKTVNSLASRMTDVERKVDFLINRSNIQVDVNPDEIAGSIMSGLDGIFNRQSWA